MATMLKTKAEDPTHAVFGTSPDGEVVALTISSGPHWIIAGQTGSGKSVFMNALLISMMSHSHPDELKIMWIDPKKVEATPYVGLPYCPLDPVTDMQDAYGLIAYLTWLMDERYEWLQLCKVKKIDEFNALWDDMDNVLNKGGQPMLKDGKPLHTDEQRQAMKDGGWSKMPYMVVVIDEYADMVMQTPDVEKNLIRIGQKARASGIHALIATQRPSADVVTPTLRANIPSRVGLKTVDATNSSIIIGEDGCEKLRGYGDGWVKDVAGNMYRVQGPFITNEEIEAIFSYLREKYPRPEPFDYKTKVVELELCEWADEYTNDVPVSQRKIKQKRASRFGR